MVETECLLLRQDKTRMSALTTVLRVPTGAIGCPGGNVSSETVADDMIFDVENPVSTRIPN